jgi:hypothetical protein
LSEHPEYCQALDQAIREYYGLPLPPAPPEE